MDERKRLGNKIHTVGSELFFAVNNVLLQTIFLIRAIHFKNSRSVLYILLSYMYQIQWIVVFLLKSNIIDEDAYDIIEDISNPCYNLTRTK